MIQKGSIFSPSLSFLLFVLDEYIQQITRRDREEEKWFEFDLKQNQPVEELLTSISGKKNFLRYRRPIAGNCAMRAKFDW